MLGEWYTHAESEPESCQIVRLAECQKPNAKVKPSASDVRVCIAGFISALECPEYPAQH